MNDAYVCGIWLYRDVFVYLLVAIALRAPVKPLGFVERGAIAIKGEDRFPIRRSKDRTRRRRKVSDV